MRLAAMRGLLTPLVTQWGKLKEAAILQELEKEALIPIFMKRVDVMIALLNRRPTEKLLKEINTKLDLAGKTLLPYANKETAGKSGEIDVDYWKKTLSAFKEKAKAEKATTNT